MEIKKLHKLVDHWYIKIYVPDDKDPTSFNREIRNWLARNIGSGTWETECGVDYVGVYFDIEAETDVMAFKLAWT
ncbi:hypothetical protein LCGC14_0694900 [marine sediment metagenome]|uniref:Uncharacterized protein n=1 Tax=marine sediment metagenome TaxID=412755 RepID=A0A0F9QJN2_9ZZZZ